MEDFEQIIKSRKYLPLKNVVIPMRFGNSEKMHLWREGKSFQLNGDSDMKYKYLTDLGIPKEHQMMNETLNDPNETRIDGWLEYQEEYGVLPPFTWDFGQTILPQWLYIQMRAFKDQAFWIINFKAHKYEYKGIETDAEELIDLLINDLAWVVVAIENHYYSDDYLEYEDIEEQRNFFLERDRLTNEKFREAMFIIGEIWHNLWW